MNVNRVFEERPAQVAAALSELRELGVRVARADAFWESAEPRPPTAGRHAYDWVVTDVRAEAMARARLRWLPIVAYSARWASSLPGTDKAAPKDPDDFAAFARAFAERYGPEGDFWRERRDLPYLPVRQYEVWNEPNLRTFWQPEPQPAVYAELYAAARDAINGADPDATVIVGGLAGRPRHDPEGFLRAMLRARPDLRGLDAVAFHPYGPDPRVALDRLRRFLRALDDEGLETVPVHLTEFGWPTRGRASVPEPVRARYLRTLLADAARLDCRIRQFAPYTWVSPREDPRDREDWYGLRTEDGLSESARVYGEFVRGSEPSACPGNGDASG